MAQLICLTDKCILQRVISDLKEILPHIQEGHEVINYDDFKQEWCQIQQQLKDFAGLKDVLYDRINVMKKQLEIMESGLQERFTKIQTINQHLQLDLVAYGVQDAIIVYKQSQCLKQDKKGIKSLINDDLEALNDKVTTIMRDLSNGLVYIDSIVGIIDKQKTIVPKSNIRKHGIKIITKPSSIQTEQIKDSVISQATLPASDQIKENYSHPIVVIQEAVPLQQQSADQQSARETMQFKQQEYKIQQQIRNQEPVVQVINPTLHYSYNQQLTTNLISDEEKQMLLTLQNSVQQKQNTIQNHLDQQPHTYQPPSYTQYQSQENNLQKSYEQVQQIKLQQNITGHQQQDDRTQNHWQSCKQSQHTYIQFDFKEETSQQHQQNYQQFIPQRQTEQKIKAPEQCPVTFAPEVAQRTSKIIKQNRFDKELSEKNIQFKDNYKEATIAGRQYLICDQVFQIRNNSTLDVLIIPKHRNTNVKIGIVCLDRWNPGSIEKYQRTQETISNRGNPFLYFEIFTIHSETIFNLQIKNKRLEYLSSGIKVNLEDKEFCYDDEVSFYIELKYCTVFIQ